METLGVYISVPFCRSKCTYCNFASGVFPESYHERYIERIIADIGDCGKFAGRLSADVPKTVDSIYLGGGTPSILAPWLLRRLFGALRTEFDFIDQPEITLECAPGQIEDDVLEAMVECGVNRVSFGVQTFTDREAAVTGRLHTRRTALRDIERVRNAGVRSVNVDLIAGLPHQTADSWRESLDTLVTTEVDHASIYMLEVDEDSRLGRELMEGGDRYHAGSVPSDDQVADFYTEAIEVLSCSGLSQYEISNFARASAASIHNQKYWLRQPYIGFGLDAHSMLRTGGLGAVRFQSGDDLQAFLKGAGVADIHPVSTQQAIEEAWFLGLRLTEGVSMLDLEREFGAKEIQGYRDLLQALSHEGLVHLSGVRVSLTERGRLLANDVFEQFIRLAPVESSELVMVD
jgi:oxygen-independent coproporphyrinogen-3 oxidase